MTQLKILQDQSDKTETLRLSPQEVAVIESLRALRFGSVEVVLHQGRVTQILRSERIRFETA